MRTCEGKGDELMVVDYDPRRPEVIADPFPAFDRLREHAPVFRSAVLGGWVITRYDDVKLVISDRRFSADRIRPFFDRLSAEDRSAYRELGESIARWSVFHDPPDHTRLRGLMNKAFTVSAVDRLVPSIRRIVDGLLDRVVGRGEMDVLTGLVHASGGRVDVDVGDGDRCPQPGGSTVDA